MKKEIIADFPSFLESLMLDCAWQSYIAEEYRVGPEGFRELADEFRKRAGPPSPRIRDHTNAIGLAYASFIDDRAPDVPRRTHGGGATVSVYIDLGDNHPGGGMRRPVKTTEKPQRNWRFGGFAPVGA